MYSSWEWTPSNICVSLPRNVAKTEGPYLLEQMMICTVKERYKNHTSIQTVLGRKPIGRWLLDSQDGIKIFHYFFLPCLQWTSNYWQYCCHSTFPVCGSMKICICIDSKTALQTMMWYNLTITLESRIF